MTASLFQERETFFIDVVLPLSLPNLFSYRVPFELNDFIKVGQRVVVPFGKNKLVTAIVRTVHQEVPKYTTKYIDFILDEQAIVTEHQLQFWEWMATYYMANIGDVMSAALPGRFKLASETKVLLNKNAGTDYSKLTDNEILIIDALEIRGVIDMKEVGQILDRKTVYPIIKRLIDKGFVLLEEELQELFTPKIDKYIQLHETIRSEGDVSSSFDQLKRSPKQEVILLKFLQLIGDSKVKRIKKGYLLEASNANSTTLKELVKKEILTEVHEEVGRLNQEVNPILKAKELAEFQEKAFIEINQEFEKQDVVLLQGVTGSGKTEIYVKQIIQCINRGEKVLYLLPEIALTTQIITRLRKYFGNKIGVYHSKFSPNERVEIWNDVLNEKFNTYDIILGARSAIFLPFRTLGLIIIDEEHETSFKQHDPAPRYHARDSAFILAKQFGAKVLMGTATPSIETMKAAKDGKIGRVSITERYGGLQMPEILCADLLDAKKKRKMHGIFSEFLLNEMKGALKRKEQIILFQNRRGYAPRWVCEQCNTTPECTRCDVSLNYHKYQHMLTCHYCGFSIQPPRRCSACGSVDLKMVGLGTEKIEEELLIHLGESVKVQRMDLDTTRSKYAYQNIISDFEEHKIDILVGTQMVSKGLDFDNVSLVGILNADDMLFYPDFRAFERAYQLMSQVSGRSGRKHKRGRVVIQASDPNHWIIQRVMHNDYEGMYEQEIYERKNFQYPPFFRMIKLTIRHREEQNTDKASLDLSLMLKKKLGNRVLGPEYTSIKRIRNQYNKFITIKYEKGASAAKVKTFIDDCLIECKQSQDFKGVRVKIDVDPI